MKKIFSMFFNREFLSFLIIGMINTLSGTAFAYVYSMIMNANLAFISGYITGLITSYILNSIVTFKEKLGIAKFIKFGISYIPNFFIQNIVVYITYNICDINKYIAFILAAAVGVPVTFLIMKLFAFRRKEEVK